VKTAKTDNAIIASRRRGDPLFPPGVDCRVAVAPRNCLLPIG